MIMPWRVSNKITLYHAVYHYNLWKRPTGDSAFAFENMDFWFNLIIIWESC